MGITHVAVEGSTFLVGASGLSVSPVFKWSTLLGRFEYFQGLPIVLADVHSYKWVVTSAGNLTCIATASNEVAFGGLLRIFAWTGASFEPFQNISIHVPLAIGTENECR